MCVYVCIYVYIYVCVCMCVYVFEREREKEIKIENLQEYDISSLGYYGLLLYLLWPYISFNSQ